MREIYANRKVRGEFTHLTLRFDGKLIYLKATKEDMGVHNEISALLGKMQSDGASLKFGKKWVEIDLFVKDRKVEYNGELLAENVDTLEKGKIENVLCNVFTKQLKKGSFRIIYRRNIEPKKNKNE